MYTPMNHARWKDKAGLGAEGLSSQGGLGLVRFGLAGVWL